MPNFDGTLGWVIAVGFPAVLLLNWAWAEWSYQRTRRDAKAKRPTGPTYDWHVPIEQMKVRERPEQQAKQRVSWHPDIDQMVERTNSYRAEHGMPALEPSETLMQSAQAKAVDMGINDYYDHRGFDMPGYWAAGENLACYFTPSDPIQGWINSPGHRHNLLNEHYREVGFGWARGKHEGRDGAVYVVARLGVRR